MDIIGRMKRLTVFGVFSLCVYVSPNGVGVDLGKFNSVRN